MRIYCYIVVKNTDLPICVRGYLSWGYENYKIVDEGTGDIITSLKGVTEIPTGMNAIVYEDEGILIRL